jgi:hypothetical protein
MLLLVLVAAVVVLAVARSTTGLADVWERLAGQAADTTAATAEPPPATSH